MKTFALAFLCALCALTVSAQPSKFEEIKKEVEAMKPRSFKAEYDKFKELTTLQGTFNPSDLGYCTVSLFSDKTLSTFNTIFYTIVARRSGRDWAWLTSREAIFLIDGKKLTLKDGRRSSNIGRGSSVYVSELLIFYVTLEEWKQIFSAEKVEFQIGQNEYKFETRYGPGCLALADFAERLKD